MNKKVVLEEHKKNANRDIRFDILKTIGILLIILAHVIPQNILFHIRSFDVPLMVIISGALFYSSSHNKNYTLRIYLQKRIPRLIAPVWFFLTFFFISYYLIFLLVGRNYPFSLKSDIIGSFLFLWGIGYVWIIRVFILVAMISTLVLKLFRACKSSNHFLGLLLIIYGCHELILILLENITIENKLLSVLIQNYFLFIIPYGCLFGLGITLPKMTRKSLLVICGIFLIVFLMMNGYYYYTQEVNLYPETFKYPPRLYYESYGIFASILAFLLVDKLTTTYNLNQQENLLTKIIIFTSSSSLWIYLWHIFFLTLPQSFLPIKLLLFKNSLMSFLVVVFLSMATTYIQKLTISRLIKKTRFGQHNSDLLATLFLK